MIQFELLRDQGILILSPDGPLEKGDFERLSQEIDPFIVSNGKLTGADDLRESLSWLGKLRCASVASPLREGSPPQDRSHRCGDG